MFFLINCFNNLFEHPYFFFFFYYYLYGLAHVSVVCLVFFQTQKLYILNIILLFEITLLFLFLTFSIFVILFRSAIFYLTHTIFSFSILFLDTTGNPRSILNSLYFKSSLSILLTSVI